MDQAENKQYRHSIRLGGFDYTQAGAYFVTICTINRICIFGRIENQKMALSPIGEIAESEWRRTREIRRNVEVDEFIIMPNHVHGILFIDEFAGPTRRVTPARIGRAFIDDDAGRPHGPAIGSIGSIIGQYKSIVVKRINQIRNSQGEPVWQRNY
jgi:putative transposase